jgi:hypothetical protein
MGGPTSVGGGCCQPGVALASCASAKLPCSQARGKPSSSSAARSVAAGAAREQVPASFVRASLHNDGTRVAVCQLCITELAPCSVVQHRLWGLESIAVGAGLSLRLPGGPWRCAYSVGLTAAV